MKRNLSKFILLLVFTLSAAITVNAQFVIKIRPTVPAYRVRPACPSRQHVWVGGNYAWNNGRYNYNHGYWAIPPRNGNRWVEGHWKQQYRRGWFWVPGHWR
jgi:WXXGXW repeat (2 copies)